MSPASKTVFITGCSDGGIGSGLAIALQKRGFHVFASARNVSKMTDLKVLEDVTLLQLDVTDANQLSTAVQTVREMTDDSLDHLISNAGRNHFMPILDENIDFVKTLFEVNLLGPIALVKAFSPLLIEAKGHITFITSIAGYLNVPYMGTYSATKRGIEIIAETLRLEIAPFGVGVMEIVTGAVQTRGQTYFGDFKLPQDSLYKPVEETIATRARGEDGHARMDLGEYSEKAAEQIINRFSGKFWYGQNAESTRRSTTASGVPQEALDAGFVQGTGLDILKGTLERNQTASD